MYGPVSRPAVGCMQALISKGVLDVVLWDALPHRVSTDGHANSKHEAYAHQILIYNHAVLALWLSGSLVVVAGTWAGAAPEPGCVAGVRSFRAVVPPPGQRRPQLEVCLVCRTRQCAHRLLLVAPLFTQLCLPTIADFRGIRAMAVLFRHRSDARQLQ